MNEIGQEKAIAKGRSDSSYWDGCDQNDIGHTDRPLERLAARSSFSGRMRHGQDKRRPAGALLQA